MTAPGRAANAFARFRSARPWALPLPPIILWVLAFAGPAWLIRFEWVRVVELASHGLIEPQFFAALLAWVLVLAIIFLAGRIRPDDLGFDPDYAGRALGIAVMIWVAAQVIGVIPRVVANRPVLLDPAFELGSRWAMFGGLLSALATATLQETVFRGFLFIQFYLILSRRVSNLSNRVALATAGVVIVTCLVMLPEFLRLHGARTLATSVALTIAMATFLTWLFLRTRNIFFAIGVHTLLLAPATVVAGPRGGGKWFPSLVIAILASVWALLWPRRD